MRAAPKLAAAPVATSAAVAHAAQERAPARAEQREPDALSRDAFFSWLSRHSYRLTRVDEIRDRFVRRRRFGQLVPAAKVDWLQEHSDRENVPTKMAFRPDPEYQRHIVTVP